MDVTPYLQSQIKLMKSCLLLHGTAKIRPQQSMHHQTKHDEIMQENQADGQDETEIEGWSWR